MTAVRLTESMAAAAAAMKTIERWEPSEFTAGGIPWASAVDMLALGDELGLWTYAAADFATDKYMVRINGRDRVLLAAEVQGWVLGVLDSVALPIGPFRYREGLS